MKRRKKSHSVHDCCTTLSIGKAFHPGAFLSPGAQYMHFDWKSVPGVIKKTKKREKLLDESTRSKN